MTNIIKLGSILLDGAHTEPGSEYQAGQAISLGDGDDIQWVVVNGLLISDRPLLVNISWDDLNDQGLVFGKQVTINGHQFLCRLLRVGAKEGVPNEWDAALDATSDTDDLWNWSDASFWGQETLDRDESSSAYRGYLSSRFWDWVGSSFWSGSLGFRPALAPLPSNDLSPGIKVCAIGGQCMLYGTLLEVTDYDAIIQPTPDSMMAAADECECYSRLPDGPVILDRTSMVVQTIKEK